MKKFLYRSFILALIGLFHLNNKSFSQCNATFTINAADGGSTGFGSCMLGTTVTYNINSNSDLLNDNSQITWSVQGGEIISQNGGGPFSGPTTSYSYSAGVCFSGITQQRDCFTNSVTVRWGNYDSQGRAIPGQQPTYTNISVSASKLGFLHACGTRSANISQSNVVDNISPSSPLYTIQSSSPLSTLTSPLTLTLAGFLNRTLPVGTPVLYANCSTSYLDGFSLTTLSNATATWSGPFQVSPQCFCTGQQGFFYGPSYTLSSSISSPSSFYQDQYGRSVDYVSAKLSSTCPILDPQGNAYNPVIPGIAVIAGPQTLSNAAGNLPNFSSNEGATPQVLDPNCGNTSYYLNLPFNANGGTNTVTLPFGWTGSYNASPYSQTISSPTNGSGINLSYVTTTLPNYILLPGIATVTTFQGCGMPATTLLTLSGLSRFTVSLTSNFVQGCVNSPITFNAVISGNNGTYGATETAGRTPIYWSDNSYSLASVTQLVSTPTEYQAQYNKPLNSFVQYIRLQDSRNCFSAIYPNTQSDRIYFSAAGGTGLGGWSSGQLPPSPQLKTVASNLALDNSSNVYFSGTDGNVYYYGFDNASQQWLPTTIASGAYIPPTGQFSLLQVDDGNSTPGTKYVYFLKTVNFEPQLFYVSYAGGVWSTNATQVSNASEGVQVSGTNIALDTDPSSAHKGYIYFIEISNGSNIVYQYSPTFASGLYAQQVAGAVANGYLGVSPVVQNSSSATGAHGELYYENGGLLYGLPIGGTPGQIGTNISSKNLYNAKGPIVFDNIGNLYYSTLSGDIYAVPLTGLFAGENTAVNLNDGLVPGSHALTDAAGSFTIDQRNPGILYYIDYSGNIHELQSTDLVGGEITSTVATGLSDLGNNIGANASAVFSPVSSSPHLFYISGANGTQNYVYNLFNSGCLASSFRTASPQSESLNNSTVAKLQNQNTLLFSPNPSKGIVTITSSGSGEQSVTLYDALGKAAYSTTIGGPGTFELSLGNLAKGLYIGIVSGNGTTIRQRLILE